MFPLENYNKKQDPKDVAPLRTSAEIRALLGKSGENIDRSMEQFQTPGVDPQDFRFQIKAGQDNFKLRAQDQGFWESLGIKAGNLLPNVVLGLGEFAGYLGALGTEYGKDRDYSNSLTKLMQNLKDPLGEVYLENPGETFDLTDSAWWINHIGDLTESAAEFAIPGGLIGKAFKSAAGLAVAQTGSRALLKGADALARTGTAATLAYAEGAMSGYRVYETAFNKQYDQLVMAGMDPLTAQKEAKLVAADAAAATVQLNTLMNTALNMTALGPLFKRTDDDVINLFRTEGKALAGETKNTFKERMIKLADEKKILKSRQGISSYTSEALQEGLEEVNTQYAEAEGARVGEGKEKNILLALTDFEQAVRDVTNEEGALNFILGAFGGIAQTVLLDNIPLHKVAKDNRTGVPFEEGAKQEYQRVSSRQRNIAGVRKYFDNVLEAVASDVGAMDENMKKLKQYQDAGDMIGVETVKNKMFDVLALNAVQLGMGQNWISTFEEIAATSNRVDTSNLEAEMTQLDEALRATDDKAQREQINTRRIEVREAMANAKSEAMEKGLASSLEDTSYQERAREAIRDIKHYQKLHDQLYTKFNSDLEQSLGVADYMYGQAATIYRQQRMLEKINKQIMDTEAENLELYGLLSDPGSAEALDRMADTARREAAVQEGIMKQIERDHNKFMEAATAGDLKKMEEIMDRYRVVGAVTPKEAAKRLGDNMIRQAKVARENYDAIMERMEQETGYAAYKEKNPDKGVKDYMELLAGKYGAKSELDELRKHAKLLENSLSANQEAYQQLMADSDNVRKVVDKLRPVIEEERKKLQKKHIDSAIAKEQDKSAAKAHQERNRTAKETHKLNLEKRDQELRTSIQQAEQEIAQVKSDIRNLKLTEHSIWNLNWKVKMLNLESKLKKLVANFEHLRKQHLSVLDALNRNAAELLALSQNTTVEDAAQAEEQVDEVETESEQEGDTTTDTQKPPAAKRKAKKSKGPSISPAARTLAEVNGIDLTTLVGTGKNGNITKKDVQNAIDAKVAEMEEDTKDDPEAQALIKAQTGYLELLHEHIPTEAHIAFARYERVLKDGKVDPQDDSVFRELMETKAAEQQGSFRTSSKQVKAVLKALRDYVALLPTIEPADERTPEEKWDKATEKEKISAPTLIYPDQIETYDGPVIESNQREHAGMKAMEILKINAQTLIAVDWIGNDKNYRIYGNELNPNLHPDILDGTKLLKDAEVTLELDRDFDGEVRQPGVMNKKKRVRFADFLDDSGNVKDPLNVPIRILNSAGQVVGYLPTYEWLTDKYEGTSGPEEYRNIVREFEYPDGTKVDNMAIQKIQLTRVRRLIAKAGRVTTKVRSKGPGVTIKYMELDKQGKPVRKVMPAADMLPDAELRMAVVHNNAVYVGHKSTVPVANDEAVLARFVNMPVVLLPAANGQFVAEPLFTDYIESSEDIATIERAIWLYLNQAKAGQEIDDVLEQTGYDFSSSEDLRRFITSQYTYLQSFSGANTASNPEADNQNFLFNITEPVDGKAKIMIGFANSGDKPIYANIKDGKLSNEFREALQEGLKSRRRNVNFTKDQIAGINGSGKFKEFTYNGKTWKTTTHESYNDFVKAHSDTYVDGRNKLNGKYVYTANPAITLTEDMTVVLDKDKAIDATMIPTDTKTVEDSDVSELDSNDLEDLSDMFSAGESLGVKETVQTNLEQGMDMQQVTLRMLEELYNFTPPGRRNGKSPEQVFEELRQTGIPYLADGHNPFTKCG